MKGSLHGSIWIRNALLSDGWASNVLIDIDHSGTIIRALPEQKPKINSEILYGALIPGITNLHSHAHQRAMAGLAEKSSRAQNSNDSFWTWRKVMYHYLEQIEPDDIYAIANQLYIEMLKFGYTGVGEFQYLHHDVSGKPYQDRAEITKQCLYAAQNTGIAITALPVLYNFGGFGSQATSAGQKRFLNDADGFIKIVDSLAAQITGSDNVSLGIAPHSLRAINRELLQQVLSGCQYDAIHIHVAEQLKEVEDCLAWSKQKPVEWLFNHFDVDHSWCLIHATHMTSEETLKLAHSGAVVGLCPTTEANLGDGFFDVEHYFSARGRWGIGSDSHISISPVEELRWLEYGQRLLSNQRNVINSEFLSSTGAFLYLNALDGGAQATARATGKIKAGYRADFIVLDTDHPRLCGRQENDLIDSWIFSGNENPVKDVFVGGVKVITDGVHPKQETIIKQFNSTIARLAG
jgi:formimidoylglutamate deiminase